MGTGHWNGNINIAGAVQLPKNYKRIGEVEQDDLKVYVHRDVYAAKYIC